MGLSGAIIAWKVYSPQAPHAAPRHCSAKTLRLDPVWEKGSVRPLPFPPPPPESQDERWPGRPDSGRSRRELFPEEPPLEPVCDDFSDIDDLVALN